MQMDVMFGIVVVVFLLFFVCLLLLLLLFCVGGLLLFCCFFNVPVCSNIFTGVFCFLMTNFLDVVSPTSTPAE